VEALYQGRRNVSIQLEKWAQSNWKRLQMFPLRFRCGVFDKYRVRPCHLLHGRGHTAFLHCSECILPRLVVQRCVCRAKVPRMRLLRWRVRSGEWISCWLSFSRLLLEESGCVLDFCCGGMKQIGCVRHLVDWLKR
jgi:hypothetical protein